MVVISKKNSKLGKIFNISLPPVKGCVSGIPCAKDCYACKAYRLYPMVKWAWDGNLILATHYRDRYFGDIRDFLHSLSAENILFRWHTSGDILDQDYANRMNDLAKQFGHINFLAFTKNHVLNYAGLSSNLTIIFSMWPKWGNPNPAFRSAWMQDGRETRVPMDAIDCSGHCEGCEDCWHINDLRRDVVFHKH